ncbi:minor tail protein [Gordonia phage Sixama]|uniref:Minor tail protein n=1 Tax=Gordonia phage Sixama TaxID=2653271 RepID=A0A5Q2F6D2_9CAUD|nr:minor tail protein [Gordonia phage Sixama]QGF20283.1 minor tail protein [Gordonia phage Sixama]
MAVTAKLYGPFLLSLFNKEADLDTDSIKVMLCTSAYTPNQDTHRYKSSVTNEVTGPGYTAGGATLAGVTVAYDSATNTITLDANDVTWAGSSLTARYAVFYDSTPATDATRPLICYWDFGQDEVSSSGNFTLTLSASGLIAITVA